MTINTNPLESVLAAKVAAVDSSTPIESIVDILSNINKTGIQTTVAFDSAGVLPIDSNYVGSLLATRDGKYYLFTDSSVWSEMDMAVPPPPPPPAIEGLMGTVSGYVVGGYAPTVPQHMTTIVKYPFVSDTNSSSAGGLNISRRQGAGQSSSTHGYMSGGTTYPAPPPSIGPQVSRVDKFLFSTDYVTNVAPLVLSIARDNPMGQSSTTYGYTSGGYAANPNTPYPTREVNIIDKFPFAADTNATDVGDLTAKRRSGAGSSSVTHGYTLGGYNYPVYTNIIDKFPFASDGNATDVGDLTVTVRSTAGHQSSTDGYASGGSTPARSSAILKISFATDGNAVTTPANLTEAILSHSTTSSTTHGYRAGGANNAVYPTPNHSTVIDKFPFAADDNATDVGDLSVGTTVGTGVQY